MCFYQSRTLPPSSPMLVIFSVTSVLGRVEPYAVADSLSAPVLLPHLRGGLPIKLLNVRGDVSPRTPDDSVEGIPLGTTVRLAEFPDRQRACIRTSFQRVHGNLHRPPLREWVFGVPRKRDGDAEVHCGGCSIVPWPAVSGWPRAGRVPRISSSRRCRNRS